MMTRAFRRIVLACWLLDGLAVLALWIATFATGRAWEQGLFVYQNGNIPLFHVVAECLMALVTLLGVLAWIAKKRWGRLLALVGAGMFGYSAINSMGWAIHNAPALAIPMALSLAGLPLLFVLAARESAGATGNRLAPARQR